MTASSNLDLSVVVPALNEGDHLHRTMEQLRETVPPRSEIIVVVDGSADRWCDLLRASPDGVRQLQPLPKRLGDSGARDKARPRARSSCSPTAMWICGRAGGPGIAVMGRSECCGWGMHDHDHDAAPGIEWLPAPGNKSCIAMRRDLSERIGGFDTGLVRGGSEDAEPSQRLWMQGCEQRVMPDVTIDHLFRDHLFRRRFGGHPLQPASHRLRAFPPGARAPEIEQMKRFGDIAADCALLADRDTNLRRDEVQSRRSREDTYFARFGDIH